MKKKILALLLTVALCLSLAIPCFAASKPAVEIVATALMSNSVAGISIGINYCNNSAKTIKYITWYVTPYNAVGDSVRCTVTGQSQATCKTTGPIDPMSATIDTSGHLSAKSNRSTDNPFADYTYTDYRINDNGKQYWVNADKNNNFFVQRGTDYIYLTDSETQNYAYKNNMSAFQCVWYNSTIRSFRVDKAVVEFMDGSKQTISSNQLYGEKYNHRLQNKPFLDILNQYSAVYNYKDYMNYNHDLATALGGNQKALFEHFLNSGMKEGRQASSEFNLVAYKSNNPDLVALFGDDNVKYYEHYIAGGKAEGRVAFSATPSIGGTVTSDLSNEEYSQLLEKYAPVYNAKEYIRFNLDVATLGGNQKALLEHFITVGMKEGRQGSSQFNLAAYKANNPDLVALFGDDNVKYYEHYMAGGKAEGRVAV